MVKVNEDMVVERDRSDWLCICGKLGSIVMERRRASEGSSG
jgi:hypothetical protein